MYNYLIIFCFTLFYTSVFYPRNFGIGIRRFSIGGNGLARDMLEDTDEQADALLLLNYKR